MDLTCQTQHAILGSMEQFGSFSGSNLRQARLRRGWTQAELARRASVRERQIIRWENHQNEPRFEAMVALAQALGCSVRDLCGDTDEDEEAAPMATDMLRALRDQLTLAIDRERVAS
jgi:transcriptional regulator with XRE-family HTH domain